MSYTLKGRLESRLAATLLPLVVACVLAAVLPAWWPVALAALMLGVGVALDGLAYDRLLSYQAGWAAVPLGLLELGFLMVLVKGLDVRAPVGGALALFAAVWLVVQLLAHAGFPLLRLSYAEDGGELGGLGALAGVASLATLAVAGGIYWAKLPPTVHLASGVHQGPLVITRRENLIGERGTIVRGGIVIRASNVTVRDVSVVGGENGIEVDGGIAGTRGVVLDGVSIVGAKMDGIHVRRSQVTIRDCVIASPAGYTQGIDISFTADMGMSVVEDCTVTGGREGIVVDSALAMVHQNRVSATTLRAINMNEMSMGMIAHNQVTGALGVGIFCGDQSECMIERNRVSGTRADHVSGDIAQMGYGIESHYKSIAELADNELVGNAHGIGTFAAGVAHHKR